MDLARLAAAMFVLFGYFPPLFPSARDDNLDLFLKVFRGNWRLVPIANFAVGPGCHDRMERNHTELARCVSKVPQETHLVAAYGPPKTCTVHKEIVISESDG